MADDKLDFLDETETPEALAEEPIAEEVVEATTEEAPQVEAEAETGAEPPEVPPTPAVEEEKQAVPVMALLDEREKRQAAERKSEETAKAMQALEARLKQMEAPQEKPDYFDNPERAISQQLNTVKLQQSKFLAEREFGAETVAAAYAYFDQNPQESQQLMNHPSPFHAAVEMFNQKQLLQEIGSDPAAWKAAQLEELKAQFAAEVQSQTPVTPKAPPPSMARAPRAGGEGRAPGNAFDQTFS